MVIIIFPPITQTLESIQDDFQKKSIYKLIINGRIVGSVRCYVENDTCHIGRLVVDKSFQNKGLGKLLLDKVECDNKQVPRFELFTGNKSEKNLFLYNKIGYKEFKKEHDNKLEIIFLEKGI